MWEQWKGRQYIPLLKHDGNTWKLFQMAKCPPSTKQLSIKITLQTFIGLTTRVTQDAKGAGSESEPIPVWPWALLSSVTGIIQQHQCLHHSSLKYFIHFSVFWRGGGGERVYLQRSSFADRATPELILFFMIWREAYESVLGEGLCLLCL